MSLNEILLQLPSVNSETSWSSIMIFHKESHMTQKLISQLRKSGGGPC